MTSAVLRGRDGAGLGFATGALASLAFVVLGFLSILWTPYPSTAFDVGAALQDPSGAHWLGTDPLGRDLLSLLMKGILASLVVAVVAVILAMLVGIPLGVLAARWPRLVGGVSGGLGGVLSLFPALIVAVVLATKFGASAIVPMAAIAVATIAPLARITRLSVEAYASKGYVEAAQLSGLTRWEAIKQHALRQLIVPIAAEAAGLLAIAIMWEAALSYLGLGSQPPAASLGLILHDAQSYLAAKPLLVIAPGLTLMAMMLALGLVARGLARRAAQEDAIGAA